MKEVLEEEEFIAKMEHIIKRDYFPGLLQLDNLKEKLRSRRRELTDLIHGTNNTPSSSDQPVLKEDLLSLDEFVATFTSEDNKSFEDLQEKSKEAFRNKFFWLFDCSRPALPYAGKEENEVQKALTDYEKPQHNALHFEPATVTRKAIESFEDIG